MPESLPERCLHYCGHIARIAGTNCALLDLKTGGFGGEPFSRSCDVSGERCDAYTTHLYGAYEAERWGGKYIYYCPRGLIFIATPVHMPGYPMELCLITGPIVMENYPDEPGGADCPPGVPRMTTARTRALSEVIRAVAGYLSGGEAEADVDSGDSAELLQAMYDAPHSCAGSAYPIDSERRLRRMVSEGDKEGSQRLLNELLGDLYFTSGTDPEVIRGRVGELLVLLSRAAIDGGADADEALWLCDSFTREIGGQQDILSLSRWLGAALHRFVSCVFDFPDVKHRDIVFKLEDYVRRHMAEKLTVEDAAGAVFLSKSHLCRILRQELGCTFTEFVSRLRVDRSKLFLTDPGMSLAEVAGRVGFEDQSYFTKVFRKVAGITPGQYRKSRA